LATLLTTLLIGFALATLLLLVTLLLTTLLTALVLLAALLVRIGHGRFLSCFQIMLRAITQRFAPYFGSLPRDGFALVPKTVSSLRCPLWANSCAVGPRRVTPAGVDARN